MGDDLMEKCRYFKGCSNNLCPLDAELHLRSGNNGNKCRYMREPKGATIGKRKFISGGTVMPDVLLKFVPGDNLEELNEASKRRWGEISKIS